jgi:hypothetical protein
VFIVLSHATSVTSRKIDHIFAEINEDQVLAKKYSAQDSLNKHGKFERNLTKYDGTKVLFSHLKYGRFKTIGSVFEELFNGSFILYRLIPNIPRRGGI